MRTLPVLAASLLATAMLLASCEASASPTPRPDCPSAAPSGADQERLLADADRAVVETNKGSFTIELLAEAGPMAAANFVALSRCGFYDGIAFHRVVPGQLIQGGDPLTRGRTEDFEGIGTGGPGYRFDTEVPPGGFGYDPYVVAMANAGPDTNGSQFFIPLTEMYWLGPDYSIFGRVVEGTDVVDAIGQLPTNDRQVPLDAAVIETIRIEAAAGSSPSP